MERYGSRHDVILKAAISFRVTVDFPLLGPPAVTITPLPDATRGARFIGSTELSPGMFQVEYELEEEIVPSQRHEVTGLRIRNILQSVQPIIPITATIDPTSERQFLQAVLAVEPPPPPGSPSVSVDYHTLLSEIFLDNP